MIYGEGKPYNICIVVPDKAILQKTAEILDVKTEVDMLIHSPIVQEFVAIEIRKNLKEKYGGYEIPKKFIFFDTPFTVENVFFNPNFKIKKTIGC